MSVLNVKPLRLAFAAASLCGLSACAVIPVSSDVNPALANSVQCHSFAFAGAFHGGPLSGTIANPVNEARLRSTIESHLESVGMHADASNPDCLVGYGIGLHEVVEDWAWGPGWGPGWGGPYWGGPYVYPEALVAVDLYAAQGHQPIWHASARLAQRDLEGERAPQGIDAAVGAIFAHYLH